MWFYRKKALQSENANTAKSQFLSTMSHEIRTPMNAVIGISELILRENISPTVRDYIVHIKQSGAALIAIINDILDFSKIESGKMEIHPGKYGLSSLLNDVVTIIGIRLHEKPLQFKVEIDESLPYLLEGDELRVRQILLNLLGNAVKYTKEGYIRFKVSDGGRDRDTINVKFEISDSGIGIKEEDLKKIFGDFVRFDSDKNRNVEGTGLGLAITNSLCRLMGGEVSVTSVYGKGSTFTVVLPQRILDERPIAGNLSVCENQVPEQSDSAVPFTAPDARILIVDDISVNLMVAEGLLAPYKMQIECCSSGADAVILTEKNYYDLVLMDHLMPGMDGIETTARIRAGKCVNLRVPIVALTANAIVGMKEMFLENGFNDYLSKPIEISALNAIIKKWVPREKQMVTGQDNIENIEKENTAAGGALNPTEGAGLAIPGIDTRRGIVLTGGSETGYRRVLAAFYKDARERLPLLKDAPREAGLADFTAHVHALKSAAATIGAADVSERAAALEAAGKAGDLTAIKQALPLFYEMLKAAADHICGALGVTTGGGPSPSPRVSAEIVPLVEKLRDALAVRDIQAIDRAIAELERECPGGELRESIGRISDLVLVTEFDAALRATTELLIRFTRN
jgi:CheY-like chemotaxis protein